MGPGAGRAEALEHRMNRSTKTVSALATAGALLAAATLAGCQSNAGPNETGGTLIGAAAGGLVGSQFGSGSGKVIATVAGVLIGGFIGNDIGKQLDENDRKRALAAQQAAYTAPVGQKIVWNNPDNGHNGSVVPVKDGTDAGGNYCREFQTTIIIGGQPQQAYGTACRQPDGTWKVVQ
jgi:surface antigen